MFSIYALTEKPDLSGQIPDLRKAFFGTARHITAIVCSGMAIWLDSWKRAFREGGFLNYGVAMYNTYAQIHNTYAMIEGMGPAFKSIGDLFKGRDEFMQLLHTRTRCAIQFDSSVWRALSLTNVSIEAKPPGDVATLLVRFEGR